MFAWEIVDILNEINDWQLKLKLIWICLILIRV